MNYFVLFVSLIIFGACSKSGGEGKVAESPIIQEASISATVGQSAPIVLDLGSIAYGKSADGMISIKQSLVTSLIPSGLVNGKLVVSGADELSIISQSGCTSIKKSTGTCSIKVRANTQGLTEGTDISGYIFFHAEGEEETFIQISATVGEAPIVEVPSLVSSASTAAFGSLSITDSSKDLILTYKALSLISSSDSHEVVVPAPFVIQAASADRCSNKTISKGASCTVKVRLDPKLVSTNGLVSGNITFAGLSIPVSATITGNPEVGQPAQSQLAWIYNGSEISALDLGTLLSSNVPVKFNLFLKNNSSSSEEVNVSFSGTGFTIINRCIEKELAPQAQCSLEVRPEQSAGSKSVSIVVVGQPSLALPLVVNVVTQTTTYQTVETTPSCSSLNLQACGGTQNISKSYVCEQYVAGVKNNSYVSNQSDCAPLANMNPLSCQSPAGELVVSISNGNLSYNCGVGVEQSSVTPDIVCSENFAYNEPNQMCEPIMVVAQWKIGERGPVSGTVQEMFVQSNGKILVADYNFLYRFNSNGSKDSSFAFLPLINFSGTVNSIAEQSDGKLIIVGNMYVNNNPINIMRLNADGTRDLSFSQSAITGITRVAVQSDDKIIVGGMNISSPYNSLVRLNKDGVVDHSFNGGVSGFPAGSVTMLDIVVQSDDKIILGGVFASYNSTTLNKRIIRLNSNGSLDGSFVAPIINAQVYDIKIQTDGKLVYGGGEFKRLNSDGSIDSSFTVGVFSPNRIESLDILPDGKMMVGGYFTSFHGTSYSRIIKLNSNGSVDTSFNIGTGFDADVNKLSVLSNGNIMVGGAFSKYNELVGTNLALLRPPQNAEVSYVNEMAYNSGFDWGAKKVVKQPDGKLLVMGDFNKYNGQDISKLVRLNVDGTVDNSFSFPSNIVAMGTAVNALELLPDGKILIGGSFGFTKLNSNGSVDTSFNTGTGFAGLYGFFYVSVIKYNPIMNKIIVGGNFNSYNGSPAKKLAVISLDGEIDINRDYYFDNAVTEIAIQSDGKMLVGGSFSYYYGKTIVGGGGMPGPPPPDINTCHVVRINIDSTPDYSFENADLSGSCAIGSGGTVSIIQIDSTGNIFVGGDMISGGAVSNLYKLSSSGTVINIFNTSNTLNVTGINVQIDGKIIVAGNGGSSWYQGPFFSRYESNGMIDSSFNAGISAVNSGISSMVENEDGSFIMVGEFSRYNGINLMGIMKLKENSSSQFLPQ